MRTMSAGDIGVGCSLLLALVSSVVVAAQGVEPPTRPPDRVDSTPPDIQKCCQIDEVIVEATLGGPRHCEKLEVVRVHLESTAPVDAWRPRFSSGASPEHGQDDDGDEEVFIGQVPASYVVRVGNPDCAEDEVTMAIRDLDDDTAAAEGRDDMWLLSNGSLLHRHRLLRPHRQRQHGDGDDDPDGDLAYPLGKYCVDDIVTMVNLDDDDHLDGNDTEHRSLSRQHRFAFVCGRHHQASAAEVFEDQAYPALLAVSMACLVATLLMYFVLPQLRDLTGKFILGICASALASLALSLADVIGWRDANVDRLTTELLMNAGVLCIWLCLNAMGHHVWLVIRSKTIFTRTTDGQRLLYYSLYIAGVASLVTVAAAMVHHLAPDHGHFGHFRIGVACLAVFYAPVALLLVVNIYFYWTAHRIMATQLVYNRTMQHFQVNFDLYTKFLVVIGTWWLINTLGVLMIHEALTYLSMSMNILLGPLVFVVAMCRTRVAFLFKKYFCLGTDCCSCCCKSFLGNFTNDPEFIEDECQELNTIDSLKAKLDRQDGERDPFLASRLQTTNGIIRGTSAHHHRDLSVSLFSVRHNRREPGEVPAPLDPDQPVGTIKKILKSNSLNALANINFGWRKETSV